MDLVKGATWNILKFRGSSASLSSPPLSISYITWRP